MKRTIALIVAGILICAGCAATPKSYRTSSTVVPATQEHEYAVKFEVVTIGKEGEESMLTSPTLTLKAGQKAETSIASEGDGVFCTALVTERDNETTALTEVKISINGREVFSNAQTLSVRHTN